MTYKIKDIETPDGIIQRALPEDNGYREEYFSCDCAADEHTIKFTYFVDNTNNIEDAEIYLSVFLDNPPFLQRLWIGIKYIFGSKSKYGHFGNWILRPVDAKRLRSMVDKLIEFHTPTIESAVPTPVGPLSGNDNEN